MAYGQVSTPWAVSPRRLTFGAGVATYIVAASNSVNRNKADYVCDGTADEVEINQALNALPTTGGYVHLLEGTYNIAASIVIPISNVSLIGAGRATRIQITSNIIMISCSNQNYIHIEKLCLYGAGSGNLSNIGIEFDDVNESSISDCWIHNCGAWGIRIVTSSSNNTIHGNFCSNNFVDGIEVYGLSANYNSIIGNQCNNNTDEGIGITTTRFNTVLGNQCNDNGDNGIIVSGSTFTIVVGNQCNDNTGHGIRVSTSSDCIVENNICRNNISGIFLATSLEVIVSGNRCTGNSGYGINISNVGCLGVIVSENQLRNNTTGALNDSGTANTMYGNVEDTTGDFIVYSGGQRVLRIDDNGLLRIRGEVWTNEAL